MPFEPPCCPDPDCPSHDSRLAWSWCHDGTYSRACDGRVVQRFRCNDCGRRFSSQTFRGDYRHKKPKLNAQLFRLLISKVTLRQAARVLRVNKKTITRRLPRMGATAKAVHEKLAPRRDGADFLEGGFLLDELETYADSRRNNPLTVPVLIHKESFFVVDTEVGPLPRRGGRGRDENEPEELDEAEDRERRRGSRVAVEACCQTLARLVPEDEEVIVGSDEKHSYRVLLKDALGKRLDHQRTNSRAPRNRLNPLFRINLTLAMMRDSVSRLVRRTWAASKLEERLRDHVWIWIAWRNYVRGMTNKSPRKTPAMKIGACTRRLAPAEILRWRAPFVGSLFGR